MDPTIVVHGGAGRYLKSRQPYALKGIVAACEAGIDVLRKGGRALDAVEKAVVPMEDDPVFNAGKGSSLNLCGQIEMDAAIMDGSNLRAGAVAMISSVKNPVRLARLVMERTDHVLLAGKFAEKLARAWGLPRMNPYTEHRVNVWKKSRRELIRGKLTYFTRNRLLSESLRSEHETVGALAIDRCGDLAAATSTGGITLKLPGRLGDSPLIGAGLYADNHSGAATATGIGEAAVRLAICRTACIMMEDGYSAQAVAKRTIRLVSSRLGLQLGIITLDRKSRPSAAHNSPHLAWAYASRKHPKPKAALAGDKIPLRV